MEQETGILTGSGTTSGTSTKQEEETPLIEEKKVMKVMVGLDESDASFYGLNWALQHLFTPKTLVDDPSVSLNEEGCLVYLAHVQTSFQNYVYPAGPGLHTAAFAASSVVESVRQAQAEVSARILERALSFCTHNKVRAETLILEGDPKEEICKAIEQTHVDMLVVGSRGLGQIKRAFLGSVSDYCAHHASCPVLIVKPPKEAHLSLNTKRSQ
ncbi:universal stress protein PHOS34-like [Silene latifolia]|uniref:universal stress protein PHOS34-like n=1 Tax=Silene latifolia TaxID=37657 RepID=UPI003D776C35